MSGMSVNFYDLCRICTKFANSDEKLHIFSAEGRRKNLSQKISDCLALNIEEKDRLPKVLCAQCYQHIESNVEFREICKKSQVTLNTWLNSANNANNGTKAYIKDEISPSSGKSLSVLGSSTAATTTSNASVTTTAQMPMVTYTTTPLSNNDILNSIVQVGGLQQQTIELNQNADKQQTFPQYTITVDKNFNRATQQPQQAEKDTKTNALEEFLKLKPNIKVTPIRKEAQKQQQQQLQQQQQQTPVPLQTQQQPTSIQTQQITVQAPQITLPTQGQTTTLPQPISHMQLQQLLQQQFQQQWQQQQLQQQLQQLSTQFQPQQITITAPTSAQANLTQTATITPNTSLNEASLSLSPSKSKKQKLNFVLTPPTSNQTSNTFQQLSNAAGTSTTQQPQIQLQLQPNTQQLQSLQQQQPTTTNAANLLTNLAPLLQQSVNMAAPLSAATGAASLLSPNKCFLPITIKDESSDQQIVAHIDAKNFVFPTTYQLQMKLQPQIATVDGQTLMLQPTSIPATLQLAPQALTNQTFQALLNTSANQLQQPQIMQQVQSQQQQEQQQQQQQLQQIQFSQSIPTTNNLQITSQQILRTPNDNDAGVAVAAEQQENQKPKAQQTQNTISQQKFRITQLPGNAFEITPTNDYETTTSSTIAATTKPVIAQTPLQQKGTPPKQQQQQVTIPTSLPTQYGGITVQRISTSTKANVAAVTNQTNQKSQEPQQQQQQLTQATKSALKIEAATAAKTNVWQKQNLTISRIPATQQQQQQQTQPKTVTTTVKATQQNQKLLMQPPPQSSIGAMKTQTQQQQPTVQQQNQYQQTPSTQQQSPKKVVRRVVGKTAPPVNKQAPQLAETAAIIQIESLPTLAKSLTFTTAPSTQTTPSTTTTTRVTIKKENANTPPKPAASSAESNNTNAVAAATSTAPTQGFKCGTCQRVFKKKEHLTQHVKLHDGIRPFKCTQAGCDKDFSRKEHLLRHIVSHSGEKQFSCDVCEKPFSRKDNLNKHRRIHTSAQNASCYTCEVCNKSFAIKSHYEEHKALHAKQETKTQPKKPVKSQQRTITIQHQPQQQQPQHHQQSQQQQQQQQTQQIQFVQHQATHHPQQTMHLPLPNVVTTDLAGNTITITQSADPNKAIGNHDTTVLNLPSHLANFVQLGQTQFVNTATGQIVSHIKIDKS